MARNVKSKILLFSLAAASISVATGHLYLGANAENTTSAIPLLSASLKGNVLSLDDGAQIASSNIYVEKGLQMVNLANLENGNAASVMLNVETDSSPEIRLKSNHVTVNNGDTFNAMNFVTYISDDSGIPPRISVDANVDMSIDGEYPVLYTVTDNEGNSSSATLSVNVQTHEEVIRAREEAERLAREEEERRLREEEERRQKEEEEKRAEEEARQREIAAQNATQFVESYVAPVYTGDGIDGQSIVDAARYWIGRGIYSYGGTNPSTGTDCSGFTQYIYRQFGIELNRTAASQANNGYQVSFEDARPGDLVLWQGHAAIYTGGNNCVGASNPSVGINEGNLWSVRSSPMIGFYRIPGVND